MKIPPTIKIGNINYKVNFDPKLSDNHQEMGMINYAQAQITLDSTLPQDRQKQAFIHEVIHGILEENGLNHRLNGEQQIGVEDLTRALEVGVLQVVEQLIKYSNDELRFAGANMTRRITEKELLNASQAESE